MFPHVLNVTALQDEYARIEAEKQRLGEDKARFELERQQFERQRNDTAASPKRASEAGLADPTNSASPLAPHPPSSASPSAAGSAFVSRLAKRYSRGSIAVPAEPDAPVRSDAATSAAMRRESSAPAVQMTATDARPVRRPLPHAVSDKPLASVTAAQPPPLRRNSLRTGTLTTSASIPEPTRRGSKPQPSSSSSDDSDDERLAALSARLKSARSRPVPAAAEAWTGADDGLLVLWWRKSLMGLQHPHPSCNAGSQGSECSEHAIQFT